MCNICGSVLHGDIPEQVAHAFLVVDPPDGLCQQDGDVHRLDLVSLRFLGVVRDRVCDHYLIDVGGLNHAGRIPRE